MKLAFGGFRDERGFSLPELLVGVTLSGLMSVALVSAVFTTNNLQRRADDRSSIASSLSIVTLLFDRDGAMALGSASAKSQTSSVACTTTMDLGFVEGGATVRYRTVASASDGPLWLERVSGSGARPIARGVQACTWQAVNDPSGDITLVVELTLAGRSGEVAAQTMRVAPRLFHAGDTLYHLHNNPTPPTGNTAQQASLPMDDTAPTATTLYNYDTNRDSAPGRLLAKGGSGAGETDLTKYQNWRTTTFASSQTISGTVTFEFWSAIKDFGTNKRGEVRVFLRGFNPATSAYTEIANATLNQGNWQAGSSTWVNRSVDISVAGFTVPAGHRLELKLVVGSIAADDMWFAYDTTAYQTRLVLP